MPTLGDIIALVRLGQEIIAACESQRRDPNAEELQQLAQLADLCRAADARLDQKLSQWLR